MRWRSRILLLLVVALIGTAAIVVAVNRRAARITATIVKVAEEKNRKLVSVEFRCDAPMTGCVARNQMQVRVAGVWLPPRSHPEVADANLLMRTNCQQLVFDFPQEAEALRINFDYCLASPRGRMCYFLWEHGISRKFPRLSKTIMNCCSKQSSLRHLEYELELPAMAPPPAKT